MADVAPTRYGGAARRLFAEQQRLRRIAFERARGGGSPVARSNATLAAPVAPVVQPGPAVVGPTTALAPATVLPPAPAPEPSGAEKATMVIGQRPPLPTHLLRQISSDGVDQSFPLHAGITAIGRALDNDIKLTDMGVSRHHAVVTVSDEEVAIADLDSSNGTTVNGVRVKEFTTLAVGDVIEIGHDRLRLERVDQGPRPPPE